MKKNVKFFAFAVLSLVLVLSSCGNKANENGWYTDFDAAKKVAAQKNKNIFLLITSMMDSETSKDGVKLLLNTPEFTKAVSDDFVCVYFDFNDIPAVMGQNPEGLTGSEQKALEKKQAFLQKQMLYADRFNVKETPAGIVTSKDGFYITPISFDYLDTSVSGYKSALYLEIGTVQDFNASIEKARSGSVYDRMKAYKDIFDVTAEIDQPGMIDLWREAVNCDKDNKSGLCGTFITTCAAVDAFTQISVGKAFDASVIFKNCAEDKRLSGEEKQIMYYQAANVLASSGMQRIDDVVDYLTKSIEAAPESQYIETLNEYLEEAKQYKVQIDEQKKIADDNAK